MTKVVRVNMLKHTIYPQYIAHRGASHDFPENSLAAFKAAKEKGATWIEFDVKRCQSGEAIVFHDAMLSRMTNSQGCVADLSLHELKKLNLKFQHNQTSEKIPTLIETIQLINQTKLNAIIEIKPDIDNIATTTLTTLNTIKEYWQHKTTHYVYTSFCWEALTLIREHEANATIALAMHRYHDNWLDYVTSLKPIALHVHFSLVTEKLIQQCRENNLTLAVFTVNDPIQAHVLFSRGVNALFSDCLV